MRTFSSFQLLFVALLAFLAISTAKEFRHSSGYGTTREEVIANREKRRVQLEELLGQAKEKMAEHKSGRKLLEEDDLTALERRISAYTRKLDTMQGDMDDRDVERTIERERLRQERDQQRRLERRQRASEL